MNTCTALVFKMSPWISNTSEGPTTWQILINSASLLIRSPLIRSPFYLALALALLLSACGGGDAQSESQSESSGQRPAQTSPQATATGPAARDTLTKRDLLKAALEGQVGRVRQAVKQEVDVNVTDQAGYTPLMLASYNGHREVARFLLEHGARLGDRDKKGRTPLIFAASGSFPQMVELLLEEGADPDVTDQAEGWSALMFAAAGGHVEVVRTLLEHGADASLEDREGDTALTFARDNSHADVAALLENAE